MIIYHVMDCQRCGVGPQTCVVVTWTTIKDHANFSDLAKVAFDKIPVKQSPAFEEHQRWLCEKCLTNIATPLKPECIDPDAWISEIEQSIRILYGADVADRFLEIVTK